MEIFSIIVFTTAFLCLLCCCAYVSASLLAVSQSQPLTNDMSLVSKGGVFHRRFFSPGNSKTRYLGIKPINDSSVVLAINNTTVAWVGGCERKKVLRSCRSDDGFVKFVGLKLPDTTKTWVNSSLGLKECRAECLSNCSCMAYSNTDVRDGGKGCAIWIGDLLDMKQIPGGGQDFYVRVLASETGMKLILMFVLSNFSPLV